MKFFANSGTFRLGLRVYFVLILLFTSIIGNRCCHLRVKLDLLRGQRVKLTHMTGWLRGVSTFKVVRQLRRVPAGWMGYLMLLAAILSILSDLLVSALVQRTPLASACLFHQGLVLNAATASIYPNINAAAFSWARSAQLISIYNQDGWIGIYAKADNSTNFRATEQDVLGWWYCPETNAGLSYSWSEAVGDVMDDLINRGLLYPNAFGQQVTAPDEDQGELQLVILSSSSEGPGTSFDVLAAVDLYDDESAETKTMATYHCTVQNDSTGIITGQDGILSKINMSWVLDNSMAAVQGNFYYGQNARTSVEDPGFWLALILNSLVMASGSQESITSQVNSTNAAHHLQGCIVDGTELPGIVITIWFITTFLFLFMLTYTVNLWFKVRRAQRIYDANNHYGANSKEICDHTPNGLVDWIRHAVHEAQTPSGPGPAGVRPERHHLTTWLFSGSHLGQRLGIVSRDAVPLHPPSSGTSPISPFSVQHDVKGYGRVQQTELSP
jgi:hypothetical protein